MTDLIRIAISDKNDNPPYFDKSLYEAEVDENEDIHHTVLTVTAKDNDECKYFVISVYIMHSWPDSEVVRSKAGEPGGKRVDYIAEIPKKFYFFRGRGGPRAKAPFDPPPPHLSGPDCISCWFKIFLVFCNK